METIPLSECLSTRHTGIAAGRLKAEPHEDGASLVHIVKTAEMYTEDLDLQGWSEEIWLKDTKSQPLQPGAIVAPLKFTTKFSGVCVPSSLNPRLAGKTLFSSCNTCVLYPIKVMYSAKYIALWLRSQDAWNQIKKLSRNRNKQGLMLHRGFSTIGLKQLVTIKIPVPTLMGQELMVSRYENQLRTWRRQQREHEKVMREIDEAFTEMRGDRVVVKALSSQEDS